MSALDAFVGLLKDAPFDLTAEEIADAIWLATLTKPFVAGERPYSSEEPDAIFPADTSLPEDRLQELPAGQPTTLSPSSDPERVAEVVLPPGRAAEGPLPFRSPTAAAIHDSLALGRAIRPLKRRVSSGTRLVLDEGATATFVADTFGIWLPVMKPALSRWLDLQLIVEDSPSMRLWSRTVTELELLLQFNGAFRSVTTWRLGTEGPLALFSDRDRTGVSSREHRELIDARGRRAILIVSDCVSSAWYEATLGEWLTGWASCGPVAVLQVLPPHLWGRTALRRGLRATFSAANPGLPNTRLSTQYITPPPRTDRNLISLPIMTLEPGSLGAWARLVAGLSGECHGVALLNVGPQIGSEEVRPSPPPLPTPATRVRRFRATSSEAARRLASCLAVVPVTLPIVRLVRASLVPEASDSDIAEVFLGGLLREILFDEDPDRTEYDFHDGVRALLLDYLPGRDALRVIAQVSKYIEPRLGDARDFLAGLTAVSEEDGSSFARRQRQFAMLAVRALERLGDDYRENVVALYNELVSPDRDPGPATPRNGTRYLEDKAREYEAARQRLPAGPGRTSRLDALVEDVAHHASSNAVDPELIRTLYETGRDGARVIALGCCVGAPAVELVATVADAIRSPHTRFELWWALRAARALVESISPLHSELCVASTFEQLDGPKSLLKTRPDQAAAEMAISVVNAFAQTIGLADEYPPHAVRQWIEAGYGRPGPGRWAAILGSDPPVYSRDFCRALGARLAAHGWNVITARAWNAGPAVIDGFVSAGRAPEDVELCSSDAFESTESMRRHMITRADGAIVIAGVSRKAIGREVPRDTNIPLVAMGFYRSVAAKTASALLRSRSARDIVNLLCQVLAAGDPIVKVEAAVRLLNLAVRQRLAEGTASRKHHDTSLSKHTILFLAANPVGTNQLALDREARAIQLELERSRHRDRFELVTRWAAKPLDLLRELRQLRPTVVHFSGHGGLSMSNLSRSEGMNYRDIVAEDGERDELQDGLRFQGSNGRARRISAKALQDVFGAVGSSVPVVLLSACYSAAQAKALLAHVDCVVGTRSTIRDDAAQDFAIAFYGALVEHASIAAAYRRGCAAINLESLSDTDRPLLTVRDDVDAEHLVLATDTSATSQRTSIAAQASDHAGHDVDEVEMALLAQQLGQRGLERAAAGQYKAALAATQQAVQLYSNLERHHSDAFQPDLAMNLYNLGIRLSDLGQHEAALAATQQAVELYRQLATRNPEAFQPGLAMSLHNLSVDLSNLGQHEAALAAIREAVALRRQLAIGDPDAFQPDLAMSLNNLGIRLSDLGQREAALAATQQAVELYRQLATRKLDAFQPDLAMGLHNLSVDLSSLGQREAALAAIQEAVTIRRRLATRNPDAFQPDLAMSLNDLGSRLSDLGQHEAALAPTREAVELYRKLATHNPHAFQPDLAMSLNNLGIRLSDLEQPDAALAATREAIELYRKLATRNPDAYQPGLAMSLHNLGVDLSNLGQREAALAPTREAIELYGKLATRSPDTFQPDLAMSLNSLSLDLGYLGRRKAALAALQEAVALRRQLATRNPGAFQPDLATSLRDLGSRLSDLGQREAALAALQEAVALRRQLVARNPGAFQPDLATSLRDLGSQLSDLGQREAALAAIQEAVEIYRQLATHNSDIFQPNLAASLNNLGIRLNDLEQREAALAAIQEAVEIYRQLATRNPDAFLFDLARSLETLAAMLRGLNRREEARELMRDVQRLLSNHGKTGPSQ